jgi:hypothetical protein
MIARLTSDMVADRISQQVATILLNSRPKIQKWISSAETDDPESLGIGVGPTS